MPDPTDSPTRWYQGITSYQWLVLVLASAGWVFDVYEGQIFNLTRDQMFAEIAGHDEGTRRWYGDVFLSVFLIGGTVGGVLFGSLADRFGRRPMLIATILMYSLFSGLTFWATELWHVAALRFLVAVGVGGEWSVAASLVSEEFPARARAQAGGLFHATSIIGTWLAGLAAMAVAAQWRYAYLLGILPALLVVSIRIQMKEPVSWRQNPTRAPPGSLVELLANPRWRWRAIGGMILAATGLGTFWGVTVAGQQLAELILEANNVSAADAREEAKFAYSIVETTGGGLGLLAFGPLAAWLGRRRTFLLYQVAALAIVPIVCFLPQTYGQLLALLPVYGFFTLGMHAGFAIYFPELFPTSLRATGAGFCFNGGRLLAAPVLVYSGWLKSQIDLPLAVTILALAFLPGIAMVFLLPETKDQPLPE